MAPFKNIRTYKNSRKKPVSHSGRTLNLLLKTNLAKRFSISNDRSGASNEKSIETTFDRLKKGVQYNNFGLVRYTDNDADSEFSSIFSVSSNPDNSEEVDGESIFHSPKLNQSPVVVLERNIENFLSPRWKRGRQNNENSSSLKNMNSAGDSNLSMDFLQNNGVLNETQNGNINCDDNISQKLLEDKMILMNSLNLCSNDNEGSFMNFEVSFNRMSTPQNYFLRNTQRQPIVPRNRWHEVQKELDLNSVTEHSNSRIFENSDSILNPSTNRNSDKRTSSQGESRKKRSTKERSRSFRVSTASSTPINSRYSKLEDLNSSTRSNSANSGTFDRSSLNVSQSSKITRRKKNGLIKRTKNVRKLKKTKVILKRIPYLEKIVKDLSTGSKSVDLKFLNVKRVSNSLFSKKLPVRNCVVFLSPLKTGKENSGQSFKDSVVVVSDTEDFSEENTEYSNKIPTVQLERFLFDRSKFQESKNSSAEFKGFVSSNNFENSSKSPPENNKQKSTNNTRLSRNHDLKSKTEFFQTNRLTKNNFEAKECVVLLERMSDTMLERNRKKSKTIENVSKDMSECCVVITESIEETRLSNYVEEDEFQENYKISEFVKLEPGKKFRRSIAVLRRNSIGARNVSGKISQKRQSNMFIPLTSKKKKPTELSSFALNNSGYVSLRKSSLEKVENYLPNFEPIEGYLKHCAKTIDVQLTARDIVLKRCGQTDALDFKECYPSSALRNCQKIGEGVFGEVFMLRNKEGSVTVVKVIPIEGDQMVNLERQKTYAEILSEIVITTELSGLRTAKRNKTDAFVGVRNVHLVRGRYPDRLLELWDLYDENKRSENDSPEMFQSDQLYIVLELANGGQDLESFEFKNSQQACAVFQQVACALAVAESGLKFEHRDLHWGNVLVSFTEQTKTVFVLDGKEIVVNNCGVKATIIDFTLSRVECDDVVIFNDLSMDADLFTAKGDYQFDIYRKMRDNNGNIWQTFKPFSNVLWLHYLLGKAISIEGFRYKNVKSKQHKAGLTTLKSYEKKILDFDSATEFTKIYFMD